MKPRMQNVTSISYLKYMIASPINIWWALVTGIIVPLIGWYVLPSETIALSKIWFVGIIVALMLLLLVTVAVLFGSWSIYLNEHENIKVSNIVKDSGEHIFLLEGIKNVELGSIFEIYRIRESLESPMGLIEVKHKKEYVFSSHQSASINPFRGVS